MLDKILVAFDGSDQSKRALHYALEISEKFASELVIMTVYNRPVLPIFGTDENREKEVIDPDYHNYIATIKQSYSSILYTAEEIAKKDWPSVKYVTLLVEGRPSSMITSIAASEEVDLVVLGSRGIGGARGLVLGSTSKSVVEHCSKPVLVVK